MSTGSGAPDTDARSTADAVARRSYGKLVALLASITRPPPRARASSLARQT